MTPETLHQRIMLHELRTILLDETREGTQIHGRFAELIRENPHDATPCLVLADWLEGDELGELIRVHCELIGLLPVIRNPEYFAQFNRYRDWHPFEHEFNRFLNWHDHVMESDELSDQRLRLLERRWEIVKGLYPDREVMFSRRERLRLGENKSAKRLTKLMEENGLDPSENCAQTYDAANDCQVYSQPRKLGRTTRMLTDVLRYCCLNHGKRIMVKGEDPRQLFISAEKLCYDIDPGIPHNAWLSDTGLNLHIYDCYVHFSVPSNESLMATTWITDQQLRGLSDPALVRDRLIADGFDLNQEYQSMKDIGIGGTRFVQIKSPDITFTDHAVQQTQDQPERRWLEQRSNDMIRNREMLARMQEGGRIQYNPREEE